MSEKGIRKGKEGSDAAQGGSEGLSCWIKKIKCIRAVLEEFKQDQIRETGSEEG